MAFRHDSAAELCKEVAQQTEEQIMEAVNELIGKGSLVIETSEPLLVRDPMSDTVRFLRTVRLKLKDQERISELLGENSRLKAIIQDMRDRLEGLKVFLVGQQDDPESRGNT